MKLICEMVKIDNFIELRAIGCVQISEKSNIETCTFNSSTKCILNLPNSANFSKLLAENAFFIAKHTNY